MRAALQQMIEETVRQQVDERVAAEMEKMTAEIAQLKEHIEVLEKSKTTSKYGATGRPSPTSTAAASKSGLALKGANKTNRASPGRGLQSTAKKSGAAKTRVGGGLK